MGKQKNKKKKMRTKGPKFKFMSHVQCRNTGFRGIVTARAEYMNGVVDYLVSYFDSKGNTRIQEWIDENYLEDLEH